MITHKIEIEGAPEGWEVKRIGIPRDGECYLANGDVVSFMAGVTVPVFRIILQRTTERSCVDTKPRRIVLEEVEAGHEKVEFFHDRRCWKIVEDNKCAE